MSHVDDAVLSLPAVLQIVALVGTDGLCRQEKTGEKEERRRKWRKKGGKKEKRSGKKESKKKKKKRKNTKKKIKRKKEKKRNKVNRVWNIQCVPSLLLFKESICLSFCAEYF